MGEAKYAEGGGGGVYIGHAGKISCIVYTIVHTVKY